MFCACGLTTTSWPSPELSYEDAPIGNEGKNEGAICDTAVVSEDGGVRYVSNCPGAAYADYGFSR